MKSRVIFFIISYLIWLGLTFSLEPVRLFVGLLAALIATWIAGDLFTKNPWKFTKPLKYFYFYLYIPLLFWEMLKANLDVAWRVIHPKRPINPGIVKIKTSLRSEAGLTFLANSITLTPGTLSIDIEPENGILYIHWIDVKSKNIEETSRIIASRFEKILTKIFE
ncbi:MAG: Na(+)/H(+) antiporter subunit E [candidate division WS2 bacterium]|nr:Na(+)/H(+) antiporter subunit E [Candidatus Lithacetigena glycinireducens]